MVDAHRARLQREALARLTPQLAAKAAKRKLYQRNFLAYAKATLPGYKAGWVHRDLAARLQRFHEDVVAQKSPRLLIIAPPRHGKSFLAAERFPAWHLGRCPDHEIIVGSYAQRIARKRSRECRRVVRSQLHQDTFGPLDADPKGELSLDGFDELLDTADDERCPGFELDTSAQSVTEWETTAGGGLLATGTQGGATGLGAHVLIIDDPHKDWAEASSETIREKVWDWYGSTAFTRLAPGGGVILILTRWHEDDLAGRLIALDKATEGASPWEVVRYPAIAEEDEEHRSVGEPLHPERFSKAQLLEIKRTVGERKWLALYQGRPSSAEGSTWKRSWWRYWVDRELTPEEEASGLYTRKPARFDEELISLDASFGAQSDDASFCVLQHWGRSGARKFLLAEERGRWKSPELRRRFKAACKRWPKAKAKLIEYKALGVAVADDLKKVIPGIVKVEPKGGKVVRAEAVAWQIEAGDVFLPDPIDHPWVEDDIEECTSFPNGKYDDRVDAKSQALGHFDRRRRRYV